MYILLNSYAYEVRQTYIHFIRAACRDPLPVGTYRVRSHGPVRSSLFDDACMHAVIIGVGSVYLRIIPKILH